MYFSIVVIALVVAVIDWVAVGYGWRKVEYIAKPGVMFFLITWIVLLGGIHELHLFWFLMGAIFSLFGDVFMLRDDKPGLFLMGLVSFLLAHLAYIVALNNPIAQFSAKTLFLAGSIFIILLLAGRRVLSGVRQKGWEKLNFPIISYIVIIGTMLFSACSTIFRPDWDTTPAILTALGAVLFTLSDLCLAWNKFVSPIRYGRLILMVAYHLGQTAILLGAVLQFS
jgi:uncharacterized membrane protein YhhN